MKNQTILAIEINAQISQIVNQIKELTDEEVKRYTIKNFIKELEALYGVNTRNLEKPTIRGIEFRPKGGIAGEIFSYENKKQSNEPQSTQILEKEDIPSQRFEVSEIEKDINFPQEVPFDKLEQEPEKEIENPLHKMEDIKHKIIEAKVKSQVIFPEKLQHSSGAVLEEIKEDELIYKPVYALGDNQRFYGIPGEWNVVVTKENDKYITQHPMEFLDKLELTPYTL